MLWSVGYLPAFWSPLTQQISWYFFLLIFDGISTHFIPRLLKTFLAYVRYENFFLK